MNTVWAESIGKIKKKNLIEAMDLEYREIVLNQRLIDVYYAKCNLANIIDAKNLQRIDSAK